MDNLLHFLSRHKFDIIRAAASLGISALVLLVLPSVIMWNASPTTGMMFCIMLFFAVNPVLCCAAGIFAGQDIRNRWFIALFPPLLFLMSIKLIFDGDTGLMAYEVIYSAITALVTVFTFIIKKYRQKKG